MAEDRFSTLNEEEFKQLLENKDASNTKRSTAFAVRTLKAYLKEKGQPEKFEDLGRKELDQLLCKFYAEARQENGELYKRSSLIAIRHGISRHIQLCSGGAIDIINDKEFSQSKVSFLAASKELKREGKGGIDHHPPIEHADLQKMYAYFSKSLEDSVTLQEKVFVDISLYFGRRGRENLHQLLISDFAARTDGEGKLYIYMVKDELTKNHQDDPNSAEGRMYKIPDDPMCPVRSFMMYKRRLNSGCSRLFQRPSKGNSNWYDKVPLGHNSIGGMMVKISEKAGLSVRYTNHSLRATAVHILDSAGDFSSRHIKTVTGHKSENSLKTYTGYTDPKIKRKMSETISSNLRTNEPRAKVCYLDSNANEVSIAPNEIQLEPLTDSEINELTAGIDFDANVLSEFGSLQGSESTAGMEGPLQLNPTMPLRSHTNNTLNIHSSTRVTHPANCAPHPLPVPYLNNCSNVTINFNFK